MPKTRIAGSFVALITPFNKDGSVDFEGFRTLLRFQEDHGTAAVLIMGSTGEVSMLSPAERQQIIVETARMKTGRMQFFYGCTGNSTAATIEYLKFARGNGADGAILAAPAYICASEADIEAYFLEVADATDLPLGIYNNPPRVKTDLHWDSLLRIFRHPNYVVHKESTTRVGQVAQVLRGRPDVSVMCCDSPNLGLVVRATVGSAVVRGFDPLQTGPEPAIMPGSEVAAALLLRPGVTDDRVDPRSPQAGEFLDGAWVRRPAGRDRVIAEQRVFAVELVDPVDQVAPVLVAGPGGPP